jgi:hypothetical protein
MIIWGSSGKAVDAGEAGTHYCEVCKEQRSFRYLVTYTMRHIWYLVRWSTGQKWFRTCQVCNNNFNSEAPVAPSAGIDEGKKPKSPIPAFDRWGWAFALGAFTLLVVFAVITGNAEDEADAKLLAAPKVGDRYVVKIEKFLGEPKSETIINNNYGIVRVSAVDANGVTLDLPKMIWSRPSKLSREIDSDAKLDSYYNERIEMSVADLVALDKKGVIDNVER